MDLSNIGLQTWCSGAGPGTVEIPEVVITPGPDFKPAATHGALFGVLGGLAAAAALITLVTYAEKKGGA